MSQINQNRLTDDLDVQSTIAPVDAAAPPTATGVDCQNHVSTAVLFHFGVLDDGTITPSVEESDDNSSWSAATTSPSAGTAVTTSNDNPNVQVISVLRTKRYVRAVVTETVASAGYLLSASVIGVKKRT